ncbi:MAG TPA: hypothetical protein VHG51_18140 [Longimicrobiaceae bacterium]|nr:hypothetical protein [Longimicrobiaceae bacterium]
MSAEHAAKSGRIPGDVLLRWVRNASMVGFLAGLAAGLAAALN